MPKQALYLKWRPQAFDDVIGQEHITRTLRNAIDRGRIRHAYLFSGPRGTGKTTTARLLAAALGCRNMDLIEIDAASHTGVDDVRDLRDKIAFMPSEGQYKVYIIDEVHRFSGSAFDALLKTLEEPPPHAIFVLATTEIDKVPDTIKSRCLQFEFRRVALNEVADRLQAIAEAEGMKIDRAALELIARHGTGSVRDSISLLDQIVADPEEHVTLELAQRVLGTASSEAVQQVAAAILQRDTVAGLHTINQAIDSGSDPRQFGQQLVEHLRYVLLAQTASADLIEASDEMRQVYAQQAQAVNKPELLRAIRAFNEAVNDQRGGWHPQLALELALVEATQGAASAAGGASAAAPAVDMHTLERHVEQMIRQQLATAPSAAAQGAAASQPQHEAETVMADDNFDKSAPAVVAAAELQKRWGEAQAIVRTRNQQVAAYMDYAQVMSVAGNVVTIGAKTDVFLERLQVPDNLKMIQYVISQMVGQSLKLRVVRAESAGESTINDDPLAQFGRNELGATNVRPVDDNHS